MCLLSPLSTPGYEQTFSRVAYRGIDHKILRIDLYPLGRGGPRAELVASAMRFSSRR